MTDTENPLVLTPPEPVAPVRAEQASGLVPLDADTRDELSRRAASYVDSLSELDARSPEFSSRVGEVTSLGSAEMRAAAQQSNRMLDRSVRSLSHGAGGDAADAQARVSSSLLDLRRTVEDLDPRESSSGGVRRLLSRLPGGNKFRDHLARYASAQGTLQKIVATLRAGQDELRRDSATMHTERARLWDTMGKLQEYAVLTEALDDELRRRVEHVEATDPDQATALRADILFPVRQKHQDLLTQLAVCAQGYLAMDVVRRNNEELIKGVDRAATTTVTALRIGIMLSAALENQRKVGEQVTALRTTTDELVRGNAEMLATQSGEIQKMAADPAVGAETLRAAFQQIYRTLDTIDTYKAQATEAMAATARALSDELGDAAGHLERSRAADQREGGLA
ncbi:toxic anion resistance protein [Streptomyces radicis]|uniref:Toxic anion resistance protein n=1 Tax=Streptomyces radicis TaxID=1750517 RepID=A0A3A9VUK3_9ACTN|nr:toxic anion resistance protein [Streptomyces radicis]RKN04771.1 toxic anion resistance protein [Streptomyces radicis]RKN15977.1 toxic anion resistance protein [Streptomyces radicis]